ncbi:MAG: hypothetical protein O0X93_06420 [Methanocorpusculum sp.]|nr:hypothetical protein [Methanocorpusculum sp.]MDE2524281.1 hypothetical protein [Methanocorpusculum sp.]
MPLFILRIYDSQKSKYKEVARSHSFKYLLRRQREQYLGQKWHITVKGIA